MGRSKRSKTAHRPRKKHGTTTGDSSPPEKLSERVWAFAGDFIGLGKTHEHKQALVTAACSAWNLASTPEPRRDQLVRDYLRSYRQFNPGASEAHYASIRRDLENLITAKLKLFPTDTRQIVSAQLTPVDDGHVRLDVAAARTD